MRKLALVFCLLATQALAQQAPAPKPPKPFDPMQAALDTARGQRDEANDRLIQLTVELGAMQRKLADLTPKADKPASPAQEGASP